MAGSVSGIRAGQAFVELFADSTKLERGLNQAEKMLDAWGGRLLSIGGTMLGVGTAGAGAAFATAEAFATIAGNVGDAAERAQVLPEVFSAMSYAANLAEVSSESLEGALRKMQRTIGSAAKSAKGTSDAFDVLGLSAKELIGLSPDQQFEKIADAIAGIEDPTQKAEAAMSMFGRSGTALIPLINDGAAGIHKAMQEARGLGLVLENETVKNAQDLDDAFKKLWASVKTINVRVGEQFAPIFKSAADAIVSATNQVTTFIRENGDMLRMSLLVGVAIAGVGASLLAVGVAMTVTASLISSAITIWGALQFAIGAVAGAIGMLISPIGIFSAAVGIMGYQILNETGIIGRSLGYLSDQFLSVKEDGTEAFYGISEALRSGDIAGAVNIAWALIKLEWTRGINAIKIAWDQLWTWMQEVAVSLGYGIAQVSIKGFNLIADALDTVVTSMMQAWAGLKNYINSIWIDVVSNAIKAWNKASSVFTGKDAERKNAEVDKRATEDKKRLDAETGKEFDRYESGMQDRKDARKNRLEGVANAAADFFAAADKNHENYVAQLEKEVDIAKRNLDASLKAVRAHSVDVAEREIKSKPTEIKESMGKFSGFGRAGFAYEGGGYFAGNTYAAMMAEQAKRSADNTAKTAENTEKILNKMDGGDSFG